MESSFPKLLSLWPSGNAGYDYIEATTRVIIANGDITALSRSHQLAYGLGAPSEDGYTQKQTEKYMRRKAKLADIGAKTRVILMFQQIQILKSSELAVV